MPPKTIPFSADNTPQTIPFNHLDGFSVINAAEQNPNLLQKIGNVYQSNVVQPLQNVATGVAKKVIEPLQNVGKPIVNAYGKLINAPETKIGFPQEQLKTQGTAQEAGGIVGTVAPYFTGIGEEAAATKLTSLIPEIAAKIGLKAENFIPKVISFLASKLPSFVKNTAIATAQTESPVQGIVTGAGGEVLPIAGKAVSAAGKEIYKGLAIPTSAIEAKLLQTYKAATPFIKRIASAISEDTKAPITAAETAFRKGLLGTESMIGVQAKRATTSLWKNLVEPALQRSPNKTQAVNFFGKAEARIIKENPELSRQNSLLEALNSIKEDYKGVTEWTDAELQKLKEGWAKFVPEKTYKGRPIAGAFNEVRNILSRLARTTIYNSLGTDVRQAYIDYGNLLGIQEFGQKAMTGGKFKGGFGSFWSAAKDTVLTPVATIGGQTIYKVGQGIEFIGAPGARYLSDLFSFTPPLK